MKEVGSVMLPLACLLMVQCASWASHPDSSVRIPFGFSHYEVKARYEQTTDLGDGEPLKQHFEFNVTYDQGVQRSKGQTGYQAQVNPARGYLKMTSVPPGITQIAANETPGITMEFTGNGELMAVRGFAEASRGPVAAIMPFNFAPLYNLLLGTKAPKITQQGTVEPWDYQGRLNLKGLGEYAIVCKGKPRKAERADSHQRAVVEIVLEIPAGAVGAALLASNIPNATGKGDEVLTGVVFLDPQTGEIMAAKGSFRASITINPGDYPQQHMVVSGTFEVERLRS